MVGAGLQPQPAQSHSIYNSPALDLLCPAHDKTKTRPPNMPGDICDPHIFCFRPRPLIASG